MKSYVRSGLIWLLMLAAVLGGFILTGVALARPAAGEYSMVYSIDRSQVPPLYFNDLTLLIRVNDAATIAVLDQNQNPLPYTVADDPNWIVVTTAGNRVEVNLDGVTQINQLGAVQKAPLKDDKQWAWSHSMDDNILLQDQINMFEAKNWRGMFYPVAEIISDTREEDWILDVPDFHVLLADGWSIGSHTWKGKEEDCQEIPADKTSTIMQGYNRLAGIVATSSVPDYKLIGFAAPCFVSAYHDDILAIRDQGNTDILYNESGNGALLSLTTFGYGPPPRVDINPVMFDTDIPIGRSSSIEFSNMPRFYDTVDWVSTETGKGARFWFNTFTHGYDGISHPVNVNLQSALDHVYDNYGPGGTNEVWVAPSDQIYSYQLVRLYSEITLETQTVYFLSLPIQAGKPLP